MSLVTQATKGLFYSRHPAPCCRGYAARFLHDQKNPSSNHGTPERQQGLHFSLIVQGLSS